MCAAEFADDGAGDDEHGTDDGDGGEPVASEAADDAGPDRFAGVDDGGASGRDRALGPVHGELNREAGTAERDGGDQPDPGKRRHRLPDHWHGEQGEYSGDEQLDDGHPSEVEFAGKQTDQDDFQGDGKSADHGDNLAETPGDLEVARVGEEHQPHKGEPDTDKGQRRWALAQHNPLQQWNERHIERGDKRGSAAGHGLQPHGLQAITQVDHHTNRRACADIGPADAGQGSRKEDRADHTGRKKSDSDKEPGLAESHGNVYHQKGRAPDHGDHDQRELESGRPPRDPRTESVQHNAQDKWLFLLEVGVGESAADEEHA